MKEFVLAALVLQLPAVGCHLQSQIHLHFVRYIFP